MRTLWIEDHQLIGDSLEVLLHVVMPEISLDKARDLDSAQQLVTTFTYKLVLLDWWLGTVDGEVTIGRLRAAGCATPIIVVSGDEGELVRSRALALGAVAYVPKTAEPAVLVDTIRRSLSLSSTLRTSPTKGARGRVDADTKVDVSAAFPELTSRQADVFRRLIRGLSDKQIAKELRVADSTVKTHVRAILEIVGVHSRGQAAHEARARGASER